MNLADIEEKTYFLDMSMVKAVVDIDKALLAVNAELHSDLEQMLLEMGSKQQSLYGINIYSVGIKAIVDYLGGDYQDVVVFGDEKNDMTMFRDEWFSIAMGNAIDLLKQKADYVTDDCDKDGIYNACKHFGWI